MVNDGGHAHQTCSFMWSDNCWIISHSKTHLEQMMKDLIEEAERWDLTETRKSVVDKHSCHRVGEGNYDLHANTSRAKFLESGLLL